MYTLYIRSSCPFCMRVLQVIEEYGISVELKETTDEGVLDELIAHGGKKQVPYLIDVAAGVAMYESQDIIDYLTARTSGQDVDNNQTDLGNPINLIMGTNNVCPTEDPE